MGEHHDGSQALGSQALGWQFGSTPGGGTIRHRRSETRGRNQGWLFRDGLRSGGGREPGAGSFNNRCPPGHNSQTPVDGQSRHSGPRSTADGRGSTRGLDYFLVIVALGARIVNFYGKTRHGTET